MLEIRTTLDFDRWLKRLKDAKAAVAITRRIMRASEGNFGTIRSVGGGVVEMKIDLGPGYRVYYITVGKTVVVLLCGGDKSTQQKDIDKAQELARGLGQ